MRGQLSATQLSDLSLFLVVNLSGVLADTRKMMSDGGDVSFSLALSRPCINMAFVALRLCIINK